MNQETNTLTIGQRFALQWMMRRTLEAGSNGTKDLNACFHDTEIDKVFELVSGVVDKHADQKRQQLEREFTNALSGEETATLEIQINFGEALEQSHEMRKVLKGKFG